jgi:TrmH family RNA methyltransferase
MPKPESITSAANPLLKEVRRAVTHGGVTDQGLCVAETFHLLEEALRSECEVRTVLVAESLRSAAERHIRGLHGIKLVVLPDDLFQRLSGTETSQGVMALVKPPVWKIEQLFRGAALVVVRAMICASVVFPVPGGPQRMMEVISSRSIWRRSGLPGPRMCSWPM